MAVQGGFQGDTDWCLWEGKYCPYLTLGLCLELLSWWLAGVMLRPIKLF